jgi:hypothetical protein
MKFYNTRKTSSGQYWTTEFSANEMTNINVITLVIVSCILAPLAAIASGILALVTIHDLEDEGAVPSIFGVLISVIFLLDIYYHFIIRVILYIMFGEQWIKVFYDLNVAYIAAHIFLIFFGRFTYNRTGEKSVLFIICAAIGVIVYFISSALITIKPY